MSVTGLGFVGVFAVLLLLAFVRGPKWGLFAYLWVFYNHPPTRWWGEGLPELRWSFIAAFVTLGALAFQRMSTRQTQ